MVIEDVTTSRGSIKDAVKQYRFLGLKVENAFVIVDRQQGGAEMLSKIDMKLRNLITLQEIVEALHKKSDINESTKQATHDYMK